MKQVLILSPLHQLAPQFIRRSLDLGELHLSGSASTIAAGAIDDLRFVTAGADSRFD